jgi:hypothetical protein
VTAPPTSLSRLYDLLPAMHRIADDETGGELKALLGLINRRADAVRDDVRQLWDDYFIETSQRWVVPYIGDLVGNIPLINADVRAAAGTAESLFTDLRGPDLAVVNPLRIRELARDVTGWDARVVEFFQILDWNQHLEHLRLDCAGCPDLRSNEHTTRIGGPWDAVTHTVDVRAITTAGMGCATSASSCGGFGPRREARWCHGPSPARRGASRSARWGRMPRSSRPGTAPRPAVVGRPS